MKLAFQLAYKNLMGAGLRTWLNSGVLSFAFVVIIFFNGMIDGWNEQARIDAVNWEYGNGHLQHEQYDPSDPFSIHDSHDVLPVKERKDLVPVLVRQAVAYPQGRMMPVKINGVDVEQNTVKLPTRMLEESDEAYPVIIGKRMAASGELNKGDEVLIRWRDKNGTFDATQVTVVGIFDTNIPTVDAGQFWIPISTLWEMTGLQDHASYFIANKGYQPQNIEGWKFRSKDYLLKDLTALIKSKKAGSSIMYIMLLAIGLLAIFDTQVLSIFRRQREIGTYIALGMTRMQVVKLFTAEGSMYSIFATILGCIYGIPLFIYMANNGIGFPVSGEDMGIILAERIFPVYGARLIAGTILLVVISATIVSFLPARKIAKMDPVEALKGKLQ